MNVQLTSSQTDQVMGSEAGKRGEIDGSEFGFSAWDKRPRRRTARAASDDGGGVRGNEAGVITTLDISDIDDDDDRAGNNHGRILNIL